MNPMYRLRWVWVLWVAWVGTLEAQEPGLPRGSVRWHWKVPEVVECRDLSPLATWAVRDTDGTLWIRWKYARGSWVLRRYDLQGRPCPVSVDINERVRRQNPQVVPPPMRQFPQGEWCIAWEVSNSGLLCQRGGRVTYSVELGLRARGESMVVLGDYALDASSLWIASEWPVPTTPFGEPWKVPATTWRLIRLSRSDGKVTETYFPRPADFAPGCGIYNIVMIDDGTLWLYLGEWSRLVRRDPRGSVRTVAWDTGEPCRPSKTWLDRLLYARPWVVVSIMRWDETGPSFILEVLDSRTGRQVVRDLPVAWQLIGASPDGTWVMTRCEGQSLRVVGIDASLDPTHRAREAHKP
jgi:hypothetical protein